VVVVVGGTSYARKLLRKFNLKSVLHNIWQLCSLNIHNHYQPVGGRSGSWLRHCDTNRKVAGLIPDDVSGFFHWHDPVGRAMALGFTQPLTEMSTTNISCGVNAAGAYGWQPTTFMSQLSRNLGASTSWNLLGLSRPVIGLLYLYLLLPACTYMSSRWPTIELFSTHTLC
jgi:hypothetical protein